MQVGGLEKPESPPKKPASDVPVPEPLPTGIIPPGHAAVGAQMLTCSPFAADSIEHVVPDGHVVSPSPPEHEDVQNVSPWICAQIPPPQSALVRHPVQAGTVDTPPPPTMTGVDASPTPGPTTPPSPPRMSELPAAHPADHPATPPASRSATSTTTNREDSLFI